MLTLFLVFISLWFFIVNLVTILDLTNQLNPYYRKLSYFSLVKNFKIITYLADEKENKSEVHKNGGKLFDGIRGVCHLIILSFHFLSLVFMPNEANDSLIEMPSPVINLISFLGRFCFVTFFLMNGVASAKWFCQKFKGGKVKSTKQLIIRFFIERIGGFSPIYYFFLWFFLVYVQYFITDQSYDPIVAQNCMDSVVPNMLFISNLICTDIMVRYLNSDKK